MDKDTEEKIQNNIKETLVASMYTNGEIDSELACSIAADSVFYGLLEDYRIVPKGEVIYESEIAPGDLIRIEKDNEDDTWVRVESLDDFLDTYQNLDYYTIYLVERPISDANFIFPGKQGSVIRLEPKGLPDARTVAMRESCYWSVMGESDFYDEPELRDEYCNFEVLSDGSEQ